VVTSLLEAVPWISQLPHLAPLSRGERSP
jgi:hypothetical protein